MLWTGGGCGGAGGGEADDDANIVLRDENNYSSQGTLSIPRVETASASDLEICWDELNSDFQCHTVAPQADIDNVALLRLRLSEERAEERLAQSELAQSEVDGYLDYNTEHDGTCTRLSDMSFFGTPIEIESEYVESAENTYVLLFTEGKTPGLGARSMVFVKPTAASTNTTVHAEPGCGLLDFRAEITSALPIEVPKAGPWRVGWREITTDSQGHEIAFRNIDGIRLGFYADTTLAELEDQIFDLEELATSLWEIDIDGGRSADLAEARERDSGERFVGFNRSDGVWLLALTCGGCQHPSPLVLAVLSPVGGGGA